jgi:hypothetical protein
MRPCRPLGALPRSFPLQVQRLRSPARVVLSLLGAGATFSRPVDGGLRALPARHIPRGG